MRVRLPFTTRALSAVAVVTLLMSPSSSSVSANQPVVEGPVPRAVCGPGDSPETALQGEVPLADRMSGRSRQGYSCNLELVGQYQGQGTTWVSQSYDHCAYHSQSFPSALTGPHPGVQVVDVRDTAHPRLEGTLTSPAFLGGTWETLKVNEHRGLLAGAFAGPVVGGGSLEIYDISRDCLHPRLLNSVGQTRHSVPSNLLGHEAAWSPDGRTYWTTSLVGGLLTAIDVADPTHPRVVFVGTTGVVNHGFAFSPDGRRLYIAEADLGGAVPTTPSLMPNGMKIFDVSQVQDRRQAPKIALLAGTFWKDGAAGQHAIPVTYAGRRYVYFIDELAQGSVRLIDVSNEAAPRVVRKLKLEIQMPAHQAESTRDTVGNGTAFQYDAHYCTVDRAVDPTTLACGFFNSGIRVFDVRKPLAPREIAYFNPPAQVGRKALLTGSEHAQGLVNGSSVGIANLTADWCSSPPRFVKNQLWVTCQDNGFMVLRFTNKAYPRR